MVISHRRAAGWKPELTSQAARINKRFGRCESNLHAELELSIDELALRRQKALEIMLYVTEFYVYAITHLKQGIHRHFPLRGQIAVNDVLFDDEGLLPSCLLACQLIAA